MSIPMNDFLDAFERAWDTAHSSGDFPRLGPYADREAWSNFILGPSGLLYQVAQTFLMLDPRMRLQREFYKIDAAFIGGIDLFRSDLWYPASIHALIEHEMNNDPEVEMWKLIHWRSPLKVLMFYDWAKSEKTTPDRQQWVSSKLTGFGEMLSTVNAFHPEDPSTQYLYLVGVRPEEEAHVEWLWASSSSLQPTPLKRRG